MTSQKINSAAAYNRIVGCSDQPRLNHRLFVRNSDRISTAAFKRMVATAHARFFRARRISIDPLA